MGGIERLAVGIEAQADAAVAVYLVPLAERAKNHDSTSDVGNVTSTEGYAPIAAPSRAAQAAVTQSVTFSLFRKSPRAGDFVTVRALGAPSPNTLGLTNLLTSYPTP